MKKVTTRIAALLLTVLLTMTAYAAQTDPPSVETGIAEIKKSGNIVLTVSPGSMTALGYEPADIILVTIGDAEMEMPIGNDYTDVDSGEPVCCFRIRPGKPDEVTLSINTGNMAETMGVAELRLTDAEPGYEWVFPSGPGTDVTVRISMVAKQGYAEEYEMHRIAGTRSNTRSDYAELNDAEYANFRAVTTSGMGKDTLFRSSSPINPVLNRNREADEALLGALVRTVVNMADSEGSMRSFPDFALTRYAECDVIALNMGMNYSDAEFRRKLADGFRFMAAHDGPYLIHCVEGKDRTGFAAAILECLMGAELDEVVEDYMLTYYNYYGIEPGSSQYAGIASGNLEAALATAFEVPSIREPDTDLRVLAESYLKRIGMTPDEIRLLKDRLGRDYGGLS